MGAGLPPRGFRMPQGCDVAKLLQPYLFDVVLKLHWGLGGGWEVILFFGAKVLDQWMLKLSAAVFQ